MQIGIHGIGIHLPEQIRRNDWWPEHIVDSWRANQQAKNLARAEQDQADPLTPGARTTFEGMKAFADDPFKGAVERRVMPEGVTSADMEVAAAEEAIARAGIDRREIGLLMVYSQLPDQLVIPNTTLVHHRLGLAERCLSIGTEAGCNAFQQQFALAEAFLRTGRAKYALLVQSSAVQHLCRPEDPHSAWFGDGATAVVVGQVSEGRGLFGHAHFTDGSLHDALQGGCPGKRWWDGDRIILYVKDRSASRRMLMKIADLAKDSVDAALAEAGWKREEIAWYATHQSTRWFRQVTQEHIGLSNARSFDSFHWTGSLGACNIPFMLGMGEREGLLRDGDACALHTGGSGVVWSAMALRWGR